MSAPSSRLRRPSSPPVPPSERLVSDLQPAIEKLSAICNWQSASLQDALGATESFLRLRHTFIDHDRPSEAKDAFRHLRGFQTLLDFARLLVNIYDVTDLSQQDRRGLLMLLKDDLCVLGEALKDHPGNKRYFSKKIESNGIKTLEQILSGLIGKLGQDFENANAADTELFYGSLLAAALGQEMMCNCFSSLQKKVADIDPRNDNEHPRLSTLRGVISEVIGTVETVENSEFIGPFLRLWLEQSVDSTKKSILRVAVPISLIHICSLSRRNQLAVHSTGILTALFPILIHSERPKEERKLYRELSSTLCCEGLNSMDDAAALYRAAHSSVEVSEFLLNAIRASKNPPCIHFDLSRHGYSSIELSTLSRSFPPMTTAGYTFAVWIRVDQFDPNSHTTIFGAFDTSQACFVLAYLEKDTRNFILQTSIKGARPSVRFKSTVFAQSQWYHICVVHKRPRSTSSSRASLFVNGEYVEQVKAAYPSIPPSRPSQKPRVQTFFGTPQDVASRLGKGVSMSKWSLASGILFDEALTDDIISVFYHLGPRYHGNFQDCLGSFQTYKASAALNLRNENLHPNHEEESDIFAVIRHKGSVLIPESSILLNFSPMAILDDDDSNNVDESQLVKSLSKQAARNLHQYVRVGGNAIAINGGVPAINDALVQSHGVAILTGDPVVTVPQALDDASWRVGGCTAVHLSMVEAANTPHLLRVAVESLFESVQDSWRNSEAMERDNGYGILGMLLREKLGFPSLSQNTSFKTTPICSSLADRNAMSTELLPMILKFVGFDFDYPKRSVISNPLAYRMLLVDPDIWRLGDIPLLGIYYSQFVTFAMESYHHSFNGKRLIRMRVVKKFLDALKEETFTYESMKLFMPAFKSIVVACMSNEVLRSIALFITFSIHRQKTPPPKGNLQKKKSIRFEARPKWALSSPSPGQDAGYLTKAQVGVEVLRAYAGILCSSDNTANIKKFAKAVTNKWLLYLLVEDNAEVVVLATTILARLLVLHGSAYTRKFADKNGGFVVMRHRLKRWWRVSALWPICFAILFGLDVAAVDLDRPFDSSSFLDLFRSAGDMNVVVPEVLPVITGMLESALRSTVLGADVQNHAADSQGSGAARQRSQSIPSRSSDKSAAHRDSNPDVSLLRAVIGCLADLHCKSQGFRDFAASSSYAKELLSVLFPVVVGSDSVSACLELNSRDNKLTLRPQDAVVRPTSSGRPPLRTTTVEHAHPQGDESQPRGSSFVLVSNRSKYFPSSARLRPSVSYHTPAPPSPSSSHPIVQNIVELVTGIFTDQILTRKDSSSLGLPQKIPPGFIEHHTYFESWLLRNILSHLENAIFLDQDRLLDPRVLTNLSRLLTQVGEALYGGWYTHGAPATLNFISRVLEYVQKPDVASLKSIRLCAQAITSIRFIAGRIILLGLSEVDDSEPLHFLEKLAHWQSVVSASQDAQPDNLSLLCYLLYRKLISENDEVRLASIKVLRILLVQKPSETMAVLSHCNSPVYKRISSGFESLVNLDDVSVLRWIDDQRDDLDSIFFGVLSKVWDTFVRDENVKTEEASRARLSKRKERLRQWDQSDRFNDDLIQKQDMSFDHWTSNIFLTEQLKHQRAVQDQQDNFAFLSLAFSHIYRGMRRENGVLAETNDTKWRLDQTEGRNRMRLRIIPDDSTGPQDYQPKRKTSEPPSSKPDNRSRTTSNSETENIGVTSSALVAEPAEESSQDNDSDDRSGLEESFEMLDDPNDDQADYEDKNRKVIRSLHKGDQVQHVCNISRIVGLEASECLLILGKLNLYILDNFFQRSDGEIVNVWQAPREERDPYIGMISGRQSDSRRQNTGEHETRSWKWSDVISASKRRFLLRDVALEIFFVDGRSYLLTFMSPKIRDDLYQRLCAGSPHISGKINVSQSEDVWRFDALRSQEDQSQFFGSKLVNVFSQAPTHPATRKWMKGEISNFHYLMLVNTMAGRTFNDLTQYPVFPWVIADYTSDELDLTNPRTFRDFTKPMGAQLPEREAEFRSRYQSFAEMGDHNVRPFHYGTHYSSAMIVSSYLIRLQPFVKSYLLLQGGRFDHPDRLFYSVARAWDSASRVNMTDVRELIPEFFYLPEFLVNTNKYDFGQRQNGSQSIDSVELPPWAKGDPRIFIAKQREALESPYVSRNLHYWIDLVFGFKQRGEAALEATNVFHHLSYQGAKDLDSIEDPVERLATIGIIHNFGQTPHQVFQKSHPQREEVRHSLNRLDVAAESLTRLPFVLLDSEERVSSLIYSAKLDRLLCAAAFRLNIPPNYDKYMEWGFSDHSVRFYAAESRKLIGHCEHLHVGQLSCALFADSQTLITSGTDCTVSVWAFSSSSKSVELNPKASLFGHRSPVTILAVSRSFSTILTASKDGKIILWDLNRLEFVRSLPSFGAVDCARINDATGNIMICRNGRVDLYSLNGALILSHAVCESADETILSCAFYEGYGNEWLERELLFTGHKKGLVNVWSKTIRNGLFELDLIKQLHHVDYSRGDGVNASAGISCILPLPQVVYTGDEAGRVYEWNCVQRR